ncbi:MAG: hypothetical protein AAFX46_11410, partial [Cyanobacteria bacterium J06636_27]
VGVVEEGIDKDDLLRSVGIEPKKPVDPSLREIQEIKYPTVLQIFRSNPRFSWCRLSGDTDGGIFYYL